MGVGWQDVVALAAVALAGLFLLRKALRVVAVAKPGNVGSGCGGACSGCGAAAKEGEQVVSIQMARRPPLA